MNKRSGEKIHPELYELLKVHNTKFGLPLEFGFLCSLFKRLSISNVFLLLDLLLSSQSSRNEKISGASLSQVMKTLLTLFV